MSDRIKIMNKIGTNIFSFVVIEIKIEILLLL